MGGTKSSGSSRAGTSNVGSSGNPSNRPFRTSFVGIDTPSEWSERQEFWGDGGTGRYNIRGYVTVVPEGVRLSVLFSDIQTQGEVAFSRVSASQADAEGTFDMLLSSSRRSGPSELRRFAKTLPGMESANKWPAIQKLLDKR